MEVKRLIAVILAVTMALTLVSCAPDGPSAAENGIKPDVAAGTDGSGENAITPQEGQDDVAGVPPLSSDRVGETIVFGAYEQDNDTSNGSEDIEWIVLAQEDNRLFVVSKYVLDCKPYHTEWVDTTWEDCSLRMWLNGDFISAAFSNAEQERICTVINVNADNSEYGTSGGNDTEDRVFLLSVQEVETYMPLEASGCVPTAYALEQGALGEARYNGNAICYWLRTPGEAQNSACVIQYTGAIDLYGISVNRNQGRGAVRPAMWIEER